MSIEHLEEPLSLRAGCRGTPIRCTRGHWEEGLPVDHPFAGHAGLRRRRSFRRDCEAHQMSAACRRWKAWSALHNSERLDQANEHRSWSPFLLRVHLLETTAVTGGCDEGAVEAAIAGIDFIGSI